MCHRCYTPWLYLPQLTSDTERRILSKGLQLYSYHSTLVVTTGILIDTTYIFSIFIFLARTLQIKYYYPTFTNKLKQRDVE